MELNDSGRSGGRFDVLDANARFVVIRDEEGYGVWRLGDLEEGEPIERFSDDWALSGALSGALVFEVGVNFDQGDLFQELFKWAQLANSVAQPLTVGGFAAYVILWLEIRRRHERFVSGPRGSG